jgi:hypothetical protein
LYKKAKSKCKLGFNFVGIEIHVNYEDVIGVVYGNAVTGRLAECMGRTFGKTLWKGHGQLAGGVHCSIDNACQGITAFNSRIPCLYNLENIVSPFIIQYISEFNIIFS